MKRKTARGRKRPPAADLKKLLAAATARHKQGDLQGAERDYRAILAQAPDHFDALHLLGVTRAQAKQAKEGVELISRALRIKPDSAEAHNNLGYALSTLKRNAEAMECYRRAVALKPDYVDAQRNLGNALLAANQAGEAVACFQKVVAAKPGEANAHFNLGNALISLNRAAEAADAYGRALALKPDYAEAHSNLGNALVALNRAVPALDAYRKALALKPAMAEAHNHLGNALQDLRRHEEAVVSYEAALKSKPQFPYAPGMVAHSSAHICDWRRHAEVTRRLVDGVRADKPVSMPLVLLAASDNPADHLACASMYARNRFPAAAPLWRGERYSHDRIRVAYLSADYRDHPVALLIAELIERHDRDKFEIFGISFGPDAKVPLRERLMEGFEHFIDVRNRSDAEIAALLRESEIDIAVDLMGYTKHSRPGVFARRPAPVQVNYLGYPSTMGTDYIDYILADKFVIPADQRRHYSEKVVCLPDSYLVNDTQRRIAERTPTRAECGLPERGFVFCCFNNSFKFTPEFFDVWMRLLGRVKGSVLWLRAPNPAAAANLLREAQAHGVAPERLIFAPRVNAEDYLARYRLADLFLDTLPYNAHTTASDALWAGAPVLTLAGRTFAGRVAGSLLLAIGLPELVTNTLEDYERLAFELATQPERLAAIRGKLAASRLTAPLFDIERFRRHIESAYRTMWQTYQRGEAPRAFSVEQGDSSATRGIVAVEGKRASGAELKKLLARATDCHKRGDLPGAERDCRDILAQLPDHFDALHLLGVSRAQAGQAKEGVELISRALRIKPDSAEAHNNLGYTLDTLKQSAEAMDCYRRALALKPDFVDAQRNLGNALLAANRAEEAASCFQKVLAARPGDANAHLNLGNALISVNRAAEAADAYGRALALKPDYAEAHSNLGNALVALERTLPAIDAYRRALALKPAMAEAHNHLANALQSLGRHEEAIASYEATLRIRPDFPYALGMISHSSARICDWRRHAQATRRLVDGVRAGKPVSMPFVFLAAKDNPADQLACATTYTGDRYPAAPALWRGERYRHDRVRVAYLSADFREHPAAVLIAELIERHDRNKFEIFGISFGPDPKSAMRARLKAGFEHFIDVRDWSDVQVAAMLRKAEIDVAVDLMGYTQHCRTGIFARRPAPIQVNYLGYPGTMGADYIDYILADGFVIPAEQQMYYSEKVVCLPDSYLVNDTKRRIAERTPSRAEAGLPERGFVFCCFNNSYKITAEFFDVWLRLLARVEGSVLWLYAPGGAAAANLRREAQLRGVAPERLILAPRVKLEDYLARFRLAGLFLDTLPYNAASTASDALWAGLPVLTCAGTAFAGRMAGSQLQGIGLPELITRSLADYEALAFKLATHPAMLREVKDKLAANRLTAPLFDIERFRRHIESAYRTMWETYQRGEAPRAFSVEQGDLKATREILPARREGASVAEAHNNRGKALDAAGRAPEAIDSYQKAIAIEPGYAEAYNNLGNSLLSINRPAKAADAYGRAIAINPEYAEAHNNLGIALADLSRPADAILAYRKALAIRPSYASAHSHLGNSLLALGRHEEAIASYEAALRIRPDYPYVPGMVAHFSAHVCDWRRQRQLAQTISEGVRAGKRVMTPFAFLALSGNPADQLACATTFARDRYPAAPALWQGERYRHQRIRVAYLSADFHEHATAVLIAGLIERHDRNKFEVFGISFGPDAKSALRERLKAAFEHFVDVRDRSDADIAVLVRKSEIDIAIDLNGYTQKCRPGIFVRRPAPIQVNYLGFPGTMGVDFIDYILADAFVIPAEQQMYYSEKVVCLPDSYQANDTKRRIAGRSPTRAEAGLPERGFVFCCFNNSYKITAECFDHWMRLLNGVDGSILWLLARDAATAANLRREAEARGVDPGRLVFAPRVKSEDYLARYPLADLFLDTLPYNAHTTASDALWMGVPVLTRAGSTFAGRVAGSLLHAVGLPELVTHTGEEYERLALELATRPGRLAAIRGRLAAKRLGAPLFDADRFRCHIESAYRTMWEMHQRGEAPRAFSVAPAG